MVLVESGLTSEQVSLMRPMYNDKILQMHFGTEVSCLNFKGDS